MESYCTLNSMLLFSVCPCTAIDNIGMSKLSEPANVVWVFDVVDLIPSSDYLKV